jgi:TonB family protein
VTNLEKDAIKPKAAQLEPSETKAVGTADENKVAEAKEIKSRINKASPPSPPTKVEQRPEQNDPQPKSLLAMRETEHRDHKMAEDAHEALAAEAADGDLQRQRDKQASIAPQNAQARTDRKDAAYRFRPRPKDLVALFGKDANAPQRAEHARESKTKGVWADAKSHYQSPLENMVPEVQVGNQTALRSRKHPFARFIAQMHREIHDAWAWGFLEQLDAQGRNHPLNKFDLWSRVEIVLDRDGTIEKVTTVRHSGNLAFDAAAREVIHSSGPFPDPPQEIRSGNGKIYIHWAFHRDERACGTFGAQPFILDNAGAGDRPDPDAIVRGGKSERESLGRRLAKPRASGASGVALPPGGAGGHAHGEGDEHAGHNHGGGGEGELEGEGGEGPGAGSGGGGKAESSSADADADAEDPEAKKVANEWLHYFAAGEVDRTIARSSLPFNAGDTVAARTRDELRELVRTMHEESKAAGKPKAAKIYTAAGLRKVFGSVPAGVQEGAGKTYGVTKIGPDYMILVLEKKFGSWRVVGITR